MADVKFLFETRSEKFGVIRLEMWPEGLVLWVGGQLAWRSWIPVTLKRRNIDAA